MRPSFTLKSLKAHLQIFLAALNKGTQYIVSRSSNGGKMLIQELLRMNVSISRDHYFHEIELKYSYKGSSPVEVHCTYRCLPGTDRCSLYIPSYIDIKIAQGWIWIFCVILRFLLKGSKIVTLTNICNEVTMSPCCLTLHHILHLYCIIIDMVSRLSQESSKNH